MSKDTPTYQLIRVIIIEDNHYIREGWTTMLDADPEICVLNSYQSCEQALTAADFKHVDVMLLDIGLPGIQGTEAIELFLSENPKLSIVMATVFEDSDNIFTALENGAVGYLMKKVSPDQLVRAVKDAYEGGSPMSPNIARKIIHSMQKKSNLGKDYELSDRELEVLQLLGEGNSYAGIGRKIYLSVDGVGYHIRNIYRKMQVSSKSHAVSKGIEAGLIKINNFH